MMVEAFIIDAVRTPRGGDLGRMAAPAAGGMAPAIIIERV